MTKKIFGKANMNVVGVTYNDRQGKLLHLRNHEKNAYLTLRREKNNEYDENAIQVIAHIKDDKERKPFCIGYIPREKSIYLAKIIDDNKIVRVSRQKTDGIKQPFVIGSGKNGYNLGCQITVVFELKEQN